MFSRPGAVKTSFSAEMQLLLQCCSDSLARNSVTPSITISDRAIDWNRFVSLVARHRLFPLVNRAFKQIKDVVPAAIQGEIAIQASKNLKRMMNLAGELKLLHRLFSAHDLEFISLKGPLMVQQVYGDYSYRQTRDLDILIEEQNIDRAISMLSGAGYLLKDEYFCRHPEKRALYMNRENHVRFRHPDKMIFIELHWAVSKYFTTIKTASLFKNSTEITVQGTLFRTCPLNDYFIILATHGIYHRYELLFWLYDIAHLMSLPAINPGEVLAHAGRLNCTTSVKVSMALSKSLFNLNIPAFELQKSDLTKREQFIHDQCMIAITGADSSNRAERSGDFLNTLRQGYAHQKYLVLMTDDWHSKKRVFLNMLIKPYVWENDRKIPKSNFIYLILTQLKWIKLAISFRSSQSHDR